MQCNRPAEVYRHVVGAVVHYPVRVAVIVLGLASLDSCQEPSREVGVGAVSRWSMDGSPEVRIGVREGDRSEEFQFVSDVRLLPGGEIAVADGRQEVRVFNRAGEHLRTFVSGGDGPGEVRFLDRLLAVNDTTLLVYDTGRRRISRWRLDGSLIDGSPLGSVLIDSGEGLATTALGLAGLRRAIPDQTWFGQHRAPTELILWEPGRAPEALRPARAQEKTYRSGNYYFTPLGSGPFVGNWHGGIAFTPGDSAWVEFFDDEGTLLSRVMTARVTRAVSTEMTERWAETRFELLSSMGRPDRTLVFPWGVEPSWADELPYYDALRPADRYCVWARVFGLPWDITSTYDVIHYRMGHMAEVIVPADWQVRDVRGSRVAVLRQDSLGVQRVEIRVLNGREHERCAEP